MSNASRFLRHDDIAFQPRKKKVRKDEIRVVAGALSHPSARPPRHLERSPDNRALATLHRTVQKVEISAQLISIPRQTVYMRACMHISQKFGNVLQREKKNISFTIDFF